jgi:hypothetical protein
MYPPRSERGPAPARTGHPNNLDANRSETHRTPGVSVWRCGRCGWDTPAVDRAGCDVCGCSFGRLTARPTRPDVTDKPASGTPGADPPKSARFRSRLPGASLDVKRYTVPRNVVCGRCGREFPAGRDDARFCSPRCRVAAHRAGRVTRLEFGDHGLGETVGGGR